MPSTRRNGPTSLRKMLPPVESDADDAFFDYGYVRLNIYEIAEKSDMLTCIELQEVLNIFRHEDDEKGFMDALANGRLKGVLSRDAAILCAVFMGIDIEIGDNEESFDMCKAIRQIRAEGKSEGINEGIKIGKANTLRNLVIRLLGQSRTLLEICEITGMPRKTVKQIATEVQG